MDDIDLKILKKLLANCRVTYRELAIMTNMSVSAIHKRIKSLVDNESISAFIARPSIIALKNLSVAIFGNSNAKSMDTVSKELGQHENVYYVLIESGKHENIYLILKPVNIFFFFLMGAVSGISLFLYYLTIKNIEVSKSTILMAPTPIVTAIFAWMILGEIFTIFHLIGAIIIIFSIIIIAKPKEEKNDLK
ncbi:MAG: EamA family transporter [Promethearchaeota archaeon]|jgi:uncharacterized membrane protein